MVTPMKHIIALTILATAGTLQVAAQGGDASVKKGNDMYKKGDYINAEMYYRKALIKEPGNVNAKFNLGNAMEKQKKAEQAAAMFNDVAGSGKGVDTAMKAKAYYNKGLAMVKDNKLAGAVDAFKQALRLTPDDEHTRENLQKAMNELKQQQQQQQKQPEKQKEQPQQQQPQPPKEQKQDKSKLNQKQAEQMLGQLRDNEKQLQKQIQKGRNPAPQNKKDW
jgi:tetratricopeptide (TPR) repeat protein